MNRNKKTISIIFACIIFFTSCKTQDYFFDRESSERQMELRKHRSKNVFGDIGLIIASAFVIEALEIDTGFYPEGQEFKKIKLINPTKDTIYVNMLTDVYWDENNFCDFMDIRLPPHQKCKMLVPVDANYNVYFSNTPEQEDDEMLEINTDELNKLTLNPGMTKIEEFILNQ